MSVGAYAKQQVFKMKEFEWMIFMVKRKAEGGCVLESKLHNDQFAEISIKHRVSERQVHVTSKPDGFDTEYNFDAPIPKWIITKTALI